MNGPKESPPLEESNTHIHTPAPTTDNLPLAYILSSITGQGARRQVEGGEGGETDRCLLSGQRKVKDFQREKLTETGC